MPITRHESSSVYSKVVEVNGTIYSAGIVPTDLSRDVKGQTEEVLGEIDRLLGLCGTTRSNIVSATIWLADIRLREAMNEAWIAWIGGKDAPVRACVEAKLVDPRMLVEIAVIATK